MVKREVVGAHYGLRDWLVQRMTAVVMAVYTVMFMVMLAGVPVFNHHAWRHLFSPQWMKLATFLFLLSVFLHAWVGVRDIMMDYVKHDGLRLGLYGVFISALVVYAGWSVQILWSI